MSTKDKAVSGLIWSGIDTLGLNGIRIIITLILARLLEPKDFGILGMLNIFMALSDVLIQSGFIQTLIRKPNIVDEDYSTTFLFNLFVSIFLYLLIFFSSPLIADFYNEPKLLVITRVVALSIIFNALGVIQYVYITRSLDFKKLAKINLSSTLISGIIGIIMAYLGYGVWSLVIQLLSKSIGMSLLYWLAGEPIKKFDFSLLHLRENFGFGSKIALASIIGTTMDNLYYIIIGKVYTADSLGYYYQARKFSDLPSKTIAQIFQKVSFPVLSSIQNDMQKLQNAYRRFNKMIYFISFPILAMMFLIAKPLILITLSSKWEEVIPFFQILCFAGMFYPSLTANGWITIVKGEPKLFFYLEIFYKLQVIVILLITYSISIKAMVIGFSIQLIIQWAFSVYWSARLLEIPIKQQIKDFINIYVIVLIAGLITYIVSFLTMSNFTLLIVQPLVFFFVFLAISYKINSKELIDIKALIVDKSIIRYKNK